jgi:hypothetical protein
LDKSPKLSFKGKEKNILNITTGGATAEMKPKKRSKTPQRNQRARSNFLGNDHDLK